MSREQPGAVGGGGEQEDGGPARSERGQQGVHRGGRGRGRQECVDKLEAAVR